MIRQRWGSWYAIYHCAACKRGVSYRTRMRGDATCPHCGVKDGCTILKCDVGTRRDRWATFLGIPLWRIGCQRRYAMQDDAAQTVVDDTSTTALEPA